MYSSLRITGYRGLSSFNLEGLGRINLLVGTNNSGKTSILECIEILKSAGNQSVFYSLERRGEFGHHGDEAVSSFLGITHLFANRDLHGEIGIEADRVDNEKFHNWNNKVTISVQYPSVNESELEKQILNIVDDEEPLILTVNWSNNEDQLKIGITPEGFISGHRRRFRV